LLFLIGLTAGIAFGKTQSFPIVLSVFMAAFQAVPSLALPVELGIAAGVVLSTRLN